MDDPLLDAMIETCEETYDLKPQLGQPGNRKTKAQNRKNTETYRKWHPNRIRARGFNRRSKASKSDSKTMANDIAAIYKSQKGKCWWCGKKVGDTYHVDHRVPLAQGGTNDPGNLVVSCPECNLSKGGKMPHEWSNRLL
jgi:5-methylcytosine-specific restriction endonuclease McrA